ncbi:MAG TPA: Smr/MutS family protein [Thermoanaerobaculia bacterium]|nr:Smr/MutS family protein [Thermoanaerobaculia bacterium]
MAADEPPEPDDFPTPEAIELEITDVLDLHSFPPKEVKDVVRDYLDAAYEKGLRRLRLIHGRGVGVQRRTVRALLERDPRVTAYGDAPAEAGGWGATWVEME